ncbi:spermidine synthase [Paenibacillus albiflavus]|uniref:spermidine synthase n=1 Tax=Paenibacillus albiflavus TaxID=2545760 RepID=UPI001F301740|nr:fused MFS/spermidine synthase [Paenibacillus albiflavus]
MHVLTQENSLYQEITVYESNELYGETGRFRCLQFADDAVQGAMDLRDRNHIVLEYPRVMIHLMEKNNSFFERALIIGHGIGTIASQYPSKSITVAELDAKVVELSRVWFDYQLDNVVVGDGREVLSEIEADSLDYILVDAFTKEGTPSRLTSVEFFQLALVKLNASGAILLNVTGRLKNDRLINAIYSTLGEMVPYTKAWALPAKDVSDIRNIVMMGSRHTIQCEPKQMEGFCEIELVPGHIIRDK